MRKTIKVNENYTLAFAYDVDTCGESYDIYDSQENWCGSISANEVNDNLIDEDTEEYDLEGLEILIEENLNC